MRKECSFGVIPLRRSNDEIEVLMVQHRKGHWGFPKGHPEEGEEVHQAAQRELFEEVHLTIVDWTLDVSFTETYHFDKDDERIEKLVVYFPAFVEGEVICQQEEIIASTWLLPESLELQATFSEMKCLCQNIARWIRSKP